ncbi:MAG: hypothetical protein LQ346_007298 [Caloplaca aetnensis]|nr:MAG: hypothetical protein LQ346_007298 [Caloplaca aetnensis]
MSATEPDLERGDGALKVPANHFALPSPALKPITPMANGKPQQQRIEPPLMNGSKPHPQSQARHRRQSQHHFSTKLTHDPNAIPPKLHKLRTIIGISTPSSLATTKSSSSVKNPFARPAPNLGIYARIVAEERSARFQFYFAASVINTCYFGQIVVAAALTALGASGASNIAITVLGATNTVIAGILTYLKGQGLPNRLRMYWNGLRKCREFIEDKERECAAEGWGDGIEEGSEGMDVEREIDTIVKMYHDVRQTAEGKILTPLDRKPQNPSLHLSPPFLSTATIILALRTPLTPATLAQTDNTPDTYLPGQGNSASPSGKSGAHPSSGIVTGAGAAVTPNGSVRYPEDDDYDEDEQRDQDEDIASKMGSLDPAVVKATTTTPAANPAAAATSPTTTTTAAAGAQVNGAVGK